MSEKEQFTMKRSQRVIFDDDQAKVIQEARNQVKVLADKDLTVNSFIKKSAIHRANTINNTEEGESND